MHTVCRIRVLFYVFLWKLAFYMVAHRAKIKLLVEFHSSNSRHGKTQTSLEEVGLRVIFRLMACHGITSTCKVEKFLKFH